MLNETYRKVCLKWRLGTRETRRNAAEFLTFPWQCPIKYCCTQSPGKCDNWECWTKLSRQPRLYDSLLCLLMLLMLPMAGQTAGLNGLKFFCGHSWVAGWCLRLKKSEIFFSQNFFSNFFSTGNAWPFS